MSRVTSDTTEGARKRHWLCVAIGHDWRHVWWPEALRRNMPTLWQECRRCGKKASRR